MESIDIALPINLANMTLPEPSLVNYWRNAENRIFFIDYEIDDSLTEIIKNIMYINSLDKGIPIEERKPIVLCIHSYGGDLQVAYSLIASCEVSQTPVYTVNIGCAMSAGLLILLAGKKRFCFKRSQALIHSGSALQGGTYEQLQESQKAYDKQISDMREYIMAHTKIEKKLFTKNKSKDWYISDSEQVNLGIVDKIVENMDEII